MVVDYNEPNFDLEGMAGVCYDGKEREAARSFHLERSINIHKGALVSVYNLNISRPPIAKPPSGDGKH